MTESTVRIEGNEMSAATWQYVLATGWLPSIWHWVWSLVAVGFTAWSINPPLDAFRELSFLWTFLLAMVLSFFAGGFAAIIPAWFVFGPILYAQGLENGGPFVPGDLVQVLAGEHRGRTGRVYRQWQNDTVRVELGETAKARYEDIFSAYELVRATPAATGVEIQKADIAANG